MNLIILSSIPTFVLVMIIIEAIIMVCLGGFLIFDIVRSRIKARKKEREEEEAKKREAAQKSISLDSPEEDAYASSGISELEYLRRMTKEQKEYIELLEKRISLKKELQEVEGEEAQEPTNLEYSEGETNEEYQEAFDEFWSSIPVKDGVVLEEEASPEEYIEGEEIPSEEVEHEESIYQDAEAQEAEEIIEYIDDDEAIEHPDVILEEEEFEYGSAPIEQEEAYEDAVPKDDVEDSNSFGVVITASSIHPKEDDPLEKKRQQEKIRTFLEEQKALEPKEAKEEEKEDIEYDIVEPWYCMAKPFVKKKKKYNNY